MSAGAPGRPLSVAILGTRGVPARYGGFETFAEELSARLAARGHRVAVYGRPRYVPRGVTHHRGARVRVLPTIPTKHLDTVAHAFVCSVDALFRRYDVALYCNAATVPFAALLRLFARTRVVLNVDGIERRRRKWGLLGRAWYGLCERLATRLPHAVVADAAAIRDYYRERHGVEPELIAYGASTEPATGTAALRPLGLEPGGYVLYVSRLEPENNALEVVRAFARVRTERRLVVLGDAPYAEGYIRRVREAADPRVLFPGAIYGEGYRELLSHAALHVHATEVGGTHPALLEAMGVGHLVLVNDTPENRETAGDAAVYFAARDEKDLAAKLQAALDEPGRFASLGERARRRVAEKYRWEDVADRYEALFAARDRRGDPGGARRAARRPPPSTR